jgi:glycosyltransferase involved in cell wall biosynthesis
MSGENHEGPTDGRIAYLATLYPHLSHSFVQREVDALRARGLEIHTFALHRTAPEYVLTEADREAERSTYTVLPPRLRNFAGAHLRALLTGPAAYLRTLAFALSRPPGGSHGRWWQLFYFLEAVPIWRECEKRGLTHVHAHFTSPSGDVAQLVARLGVERARPPTWSWSFSAHGTDIFNDGPASLAAKVSSASLVVCISDFGRSQLMRLAPEEQWEKVRVARCGLNGEWFQNGTPRRPERDLRLLTVGRLEREKGHSLLLEAISLLRKRLVPVRLEVVGDGSRLESLRRQAAALGISDRISFAGAVGQDRIRDHYGAADAFCLPSLGEGIPVVLMEAMACGLPVIATNMMGIPELVEDGVTGLLVTPGRPEDLAVAVERLARDRGLGRRFGEAGRRRVMEEFNLDQGAEILRTELLRALSTQRAD